MRERIFRALGCSIIGSAQSLLVFGVVVDSDEDVNIYTTQNEAVE